MASDTKPPRILTIAGSDSSGGAGIQADIKTITALGGYAMSAVTAITAQSTTGVYDIVNVPAQTVSRQIKVTVSDIGTDCVKTGMLASRAVIETVAETLSEEVPDVPAIIDPVMIATSGASLLQADAVDSLQSLLIPGATLLTPNAPEAERLTGKVVDDVNGQRRAAEALLEMGAEAALVKGGHIEGTRITDVLQTQYGEWLMEAERVGTTETHGTGCTLASAIATCHGGGLAVPDAVQTARAWMLNAIRAAPGFGAGAGPLHHGWAVKSAFSLH